MSRDSSRTYIHLHKASHADIFESFTSPDLAHTASSSDNPLSFTHNLSYPNPPAPPPQHGNANLPSGLTVGAGPSPASLPAASMQTATPLHLPPEDIYVPAHLQPPNPEDEDDVVPDEHAAFGIQRAMGRRSGARPEAAWRDLRGLNDLMRGVGFADLDDYRAEGRGAGGESRGR